MASKKKAVSKTKSKPKTKCKKTCSKNKQEETKPSFCCSVLKFLGIR